MLARTKNPATVTMMKVASSELAIILAVISD